MSRENLDRRYGFFRCTKCNKTWESSHVYCRKYTDDVVYKQDCKECSTACLPYHVEKIKCSICGETRENCTCSDEELELKRHTDPNKPHLSHLCHKCRAGKPCKGSTDYY